jgi:hypothetical protein
MTSLIHTFKYCYVIRMPLIVGGLEIIKLTIESTHLKKTKG